MLRIFLVYFKTYPSRLGNVSLSLPVMKKLVSLVQMA